MGVMEGNRARIVRRLRRKRGLGKRIRGTGERPRLSVFRSSKHIFAQIVDDERGITLCDASTRNKDLREQIQYGGNIAAAKIVGEALGKRALEKDIVSVRFDRGGYRYHGRVKGLAEAAREAGLKF